MPHRLQHARVAALEQHLAHAEGRGLEVPRADRPQVDLAVPLAQRREIVDGRLDAARHERAVLGEHLVLEVERGGARLDAERAAAVGHEAVPGVAVEPVGLGALDVEPQAGVARQRAEAASDLVLLLAAAPEVGGQGPTAVADVDRALGVRLGEAAAARRAACRSRSP